MGILWSIWGVSTALGIGGILLAFGTPLQAVGLALPLIIVAVAAGSPRRLNAAPDLWGLGGVLTALWIAWPSFLAGLPVYWLLLAAPFLLLAFGAAFQLPRGERVELLKALMDSLYPANEEDSGEVSRAWGKELRARIKAFEEGRLASSPAQEAIARLREQLAG